MTPLLEVFQQGLHFAIYLFLLRQSSPIAACVEPLFLTLIFASFNPGSVRRLIKHLQKQSCIELQLHLPIVQTHFALNMYKHNCQGTVCRFACKLYVWTISSTAWEGGNRGQPPQAPNQGAPNWKVFKQNYFTYFDNT